MTLFKDLDQKFKFLFVGGLNTAFSFLFSIAIYEVSKTYFHILLIGLLINIFTISFSYITYKIFVFKSKGNWLREYLRCYAVYLKIAIINILLTWILVEFCGITFWVSQIMLIVSTAVLSYYGHKYFTFVKR